MNGLGTEACADASSLARDEYEPRARTGRSASHQSPVTARHQRGAIEWDRGASIRDEGARGSRGPYQTRLRALEREIARQLENGRSARSQASTLDR